MRLGIDLGGKLISVASLARLDVVAGIAVVKLLAIGVSIDARGSGGGVADAALEDSLDSAAKLAESVAEGGIVVAWVDERNDPSKRLLGRRGFGHRGPSPEPGLEDWAIVL